MESGRIIKRVPIVELLSLLEELYERGVDFIDIHSKQLNEFQDAMGISFSKDYMDEAAQETFDEFDFPIEEQDQVKINLTDEDLHKLM